MSNDQMLREPPTRDRPVPEPPPRPRPEPPPRPSPDREQPFKDDRGNPFPAIEPTNPWPNPWDQ